MNKQELKQLLAFAKSYNLMHCNAEVVAFAWKMEKASWQEDYRPESILSNMLILDGHCDYSYPNPNTGEEQLITFKLTYQGTPYEYYDEIIVDVISYEERQCLLAKVTDELNAWLEYKSAFEDDVYWTMWEDAHAE